MPAYIIYRHVTSVYYYTNQWLTMIIASTKKKKNNISLCLTIYFKNLVFRNNFQEDIFNNQRKYYFSNIAANLQIVDNFRNSSALMLYWNLIRIQRTRLDIITDHYHSTKVSKPFYFILHKWIESMQY